MNAPSLPRPRPVLAAVTKTISCATARITKRLVLETAGVPVVGDIPVAEVKSATNVVRSVTSHASAPRVVAAATVAAMVAATAEVVGVTRPAIRVVALDTCLATAARDRSATTVSVLRMVSSSY